MGQIFPVTVDDAVIVAEGLNLLELGIEADGGGNILVRKQVTYGLVMARIGLEIEISRKMPEEMHVHYKAGVAHDKFGQLRTELCRCFGFAVERDKDFV